MPNRVHSPSPIDDRITPRSFLIKIHRPLSFVPSARYSRSIPDRRNGRFVYEQSINKRLFHSGGFIGASEFIEEADGNLPKLS